ncbi:uncharacterized protein F4822DRAFT_432206 [Hypoxylon trugodes]|uniref:uncharacterized protein n=1 Tax=Hypoxylon trugodes TaxID=326681 RepID=UPI0021A1796E|nr:uncharacterized protein F4822DRAFT_432206 [Hypoxylon trugodes]KAI1385356.1 hypothetical protein F4822DRAFT_432206 [Hypoxylon trugodes]
MPDYSSNPSQTTKSDRSESKKSDDSTKTHRGSPDPDVSEPKDGSAGPHTDHDIAQDLLGFGAQFNNKK